MDQLLAGYARFRSTYWRDHGHEFAERARQGQSPWAMVVACCDSRVPPEIIFDCAPGEIFVVRSIANLIPTYAPDMANHGTSAALEYAVKELGVRHVILLGHSLCGGIRALVQGSAGKPTDFVGIWMNIAAEAGRQARVMIDDGSDVECGMPVLRARNDPHLSDEPDDVPVDRTARHGWNPEPAWLPFRHGRRRSEPDPPAAGPAS